MESSSFNCEYKREPKADKEQDMEQNVELAFPEPRSSKWESGKGTDAGESASNVHYTLNFPTVNDSKKRKESMQSMILKARTFTHQ